MKAKTNFSKKDFIVTLLCVVFLLANIAAIGTSGRKRAREAVCVSNLHQWGNIFKAFVNDNDGYFMDGYYGGGQGQSWFAVLRPYYGEGQSDHDIRADIKCCPEASKYDDSNFGELPGSTFEAWGGENTWSFVDGKRGDYGSYGTNAFINNHPYTGASFSVDHWRRPDVTAADNIPLFLDCSWVTAAPYYQNTPPLYAGAKQWSGATGGNMGLFCLPRHYGAINGLFLDFSARKIGLKQLWLLKWARTTNLEGARQNEPDWTIGTGWMVPLKDYDFIP
ncbi:MAG: hypothetical protein ACYS1A_02475 [Planctomycetota bacterium]|jgi:hypothetical protein